MELVVLSRHFPGAWKNKKKTLYKDLPASLLRERYCVREYLGSYSCGVHLVYMSASAECIQLLEKKKKDKP